MRRKTLDVAILWLIWFVLNSPSTSWAQSRVALVVGNAKYLNTAALKNPENDAEDVAKALSDIGFTVTLKLGATKRQFDQALAQFSRDAKNSEAALIYFAGHGLQYEGRNFVMPIDAELQDEVSLRYETVKVDEIKEALQSSDGVKILVLDSCRDNPLASKLMRSTNVSSRGAPVMRGFAPIEHTQGMVIVYATQADQVALDGDDRNSPFTKAFVQELAQPGVEVAALFRNVENNVEAATGGRQSPELSISGVPKYFLSKAESDKQVWERIHDRGDAAAYRDFLKRFPESAFVSDAELRLAALDSVEKPVAVEKTAAESSTKPPDALENIFWQSAEKGGAIDDYVAYLKRYPTGAFATFAINRIGDLSSRANGGAKSPAPTPAPVAAIAPTAKPAPVVTRPGPTVASPVTPPRMALKPPRRVDVVKPAKATPRPARTDAEKGRTVAPKPTSDAALRGATPDCDSGYHAVHVGGWSDYHSLSCQPN